LKAAAEKHLLRRVKGFGEKTEENILRAIELVKEGEARTFLVDAARIVDAITQGMKATKTVERIEAAGSFRRMRETVGDVDILAVAKNRAAAGAAFERLPGVVEVLASGETKAVGRHGADRGDGRSRSPPRLFVCRDLRPLRVRDGRFGDDRGTSAVAARPRSGSQSGIEGLHGPPRDRVRYPGRRRDGLPRRGIEGARLRDRLGPLAVHITGGDTDRADRGGRPEPAREYPGPSDHATDWLARTASTRPRRRLQSVRESRDRDRDRCGPEADGPELDPGARREERGLHGLRRHGQPCEWQSGLDAL